MDILTRYMTDLNWVMNNKQPGVFRTLKKSISSRLLVFNLSVSCYELFFGNFAVRPAYLYILSDLEHHQQDHSESFRLSTSMTFETSHVSRAVVSPCS